MVKPIVMATVGAGRWGTHLARIFLDHGDAELVAVADDDRDRWVALGAKLAGRPGWDAVAYGGDGMAVLDWPGLEAIAIATPAATHYPLVRAALAKGLHVFVEKPLTLDVAECEALGALARQCDRQLFVDHTYLFHPAVEAGGAWLRSRPLGPLRYGYGARVHLGPIRQDVDVLWDLAIHDIAILNHWLGAAPVAVRAIGQGWLQPGGPAIADAGVGATAGATAGAIAADRPEPSLGLADLVWLHLRYGSGIVATVHFCWHNPDKQRRLCITGDGGTLIFDELNPADPLTVRYGRTEQTEGSFVPYDERPGSIAVPAGQSLNQACDCFLQGIRRGQTDRRADVATATALVRVLAAASRSLGAGGAEVATDIT